MHAEIKSPPGDGLLFLHAQRDYSPFYPVLYPVLAVVGVTYAHSAFYYSNIEMLYLFMYSYI
jgi:hypothetical protein